MLSRRSSCETQRTWSQAPLLFSGQRTVKQKHSWSDLRPSPDSAGSVSWLQAVNAKPPCTLPGNRLNVKFNSLMNNFYSGPDSFPDPLFFQRLESVLSPSREAAGPHQGKFGYSVQPLNSTGSGYLWRPETSQDRHNYALDNLSLSHLSSIEHHLLFPELSSQEYSDGVVSECFTSTDSQQAKPSLSCVATVEPLAEYTRQQILTETVKFKATESFVSGVPMSLLSEEVGVSETGNSNQTKSNKRKMLRARSKARYIATAKSRASRARSQAKYAASAKGKLTDAQKRARYFASQKGMISRAISNTKSNAYHSALRKGFDEKQARKQGELAANNKRAELSSVFSGSVSHKP